jgi:hypothetical protein
VQDVPRDLEAQPARSGRTVSVRHLMFILLAVILASSAEAATFFYQHSGADEYSGRDACATEDEKAVCEQFGGNLALLMFRRRGWNDHQACSRSVASARNSPQHSARGAPPGAQDSRSCGWVRRMRVRR